MKKLVLIGDSIRMGYAQYAAEEFGEETIVWWPEDNCRHAEVIIENLAPWITSQNADIVHLNCGLHDMLLMGGTGKNRSSVGEYKQNLETIFSSIHATTSAQLIFALTTPVLEERQRQSTTYGRIVRRNRDPAKYNAAAREMAEKFQVPVNDLHQIVVEADPNAVLREDGVHFNDQGSRILGKAVADFVRRYL